MEINKLSELYMKLAQKYSYQSLDKDKDGNVTESEILSLAYQDEELRAELDENDLELIKDIVNTENAAEIAEIQNTSTQISVQSTAREKTEIKTMEEYKEILDKNFDELWEKFNGDSDSVIQYMKNNLGEYMDVTEDGRVDKIDLQILDNYLKTLPKCSSSDPVEQEKGRAYTKGIKDFTMELRKQTYIITSPLNDKNSYTLEDLENYVKLGGNASLLKRNLDITSIAQEENWRERLLAAGYPESELRIYKYNNDKYNGDLYNRIIKAQEFIKNNPDKVGYAGIASSYILFADKNIYDLAKTDINNDGKFDAKDLAAFSTNIDLDGDGTVSNQEITFLKKIKEQMEDFLYRDITTKSISNNASIDDIIMYYDSVGNNADVSEKLAQAMDSFNTLKGNDKAYNTDPLTGVTGLTDRGLLILLNNIGYAAQKAVRFGLQDGTSPIAPQSTWSTYNPDGEVKNIITQAINQSSPANTYLHYIQSADLSKEQLTEILNKINSAATTVQSKLANVKAAVQEKLEALS